MDAVSGRHYVDHKGRRFRVESADDCNVVIRFRGGCMVIMSRESWRTMKVRIDRGVSL